MTTVDDGIEMIATHLVENFATQRRVVEILDTTQDTQVCVSYLPDAMRPVWRETLPLWPAISRSELAERIAAIFAAMERIDGGESRRLSRVHVRKPAHYDSDIGWSGWMSADHD